MLTFRYATALQKAGFKKPRKFRKGQHWFTPEGKLGVVITSDEDCVLLQFETSTTAQFQFDKLIYAPTDEQILTAIAKAGKHRLIGKQPGSRKFEVVGSNLHQYVVGAKSSNALAKEYVNIAKSKT